MNILICKQEPLFIFHVYYYNSFLLFCLKFIIIIELHKNKNKILILCIKNLKDTLQSLFLALRLKAISLIIELRMYNE